MIYLRQSTASQEVLLGPFLDSTDGNTAETGLTIANTDIHVWKAGATTLANKNSGGATHISAGMYYAVLDATDTDTIGSGRLHVHVSGALAVIVPFTVLDEAVFDVLFGTTAPSTLAAGALMGLADDAITSAKIAAGAIGSSEAPALANLDAAVSTRSTYAGGDTSGVTTLLSRIVGTLAAGTHNAQTGDAFARLGAPVGASISADLAIVDGIVDTIVARVIGTLAAGTHNAQSGDAYARIGANGAGLSAVPWNASWDAEVQSECTDALNAYDPPTNSEMVAAIPSAAANADAVWDEALSGHTTGGSAGAALASAGAGSVDYNALADAVCDEALSGHTTAGTLGRVLSDAATASALATVDTNVDSILEDTGTTLPAAIANLPTDADVNAACDTAIADAALATAENLATVDTVVDSILADTAALDSRVPASPAAVGSAMTLEASAVDAIHDEAVDGTTTFRQSIRLINSAVAGKVSGAPTGPILFRDLADSKNRITATVDSDGNRTAVTRDAT